MTEEGDQSICRMSSGRRRSVRWLGLVAVLALGGAVGFQGRIWRTQRDLQQARVSVSRHDVGDATAHFQRHLDRHPEDSAARLEFAIWLSQVDPEAAMQQLRAISPDALELLPAARQLAAIALEMGRDYDAIGPLQLLAERLPNDPGVQLSLAQIRFREHDFDSAFQHARRCFELLPTQVDACLLMAESLDELKRPDEMLAPLEHALQLDPQLPQAHLNLGYALQLAGRNDEALEHVNWFLQRYPNTAAAHRILALIERAEGRPEAALSAVRRALRIQPRNLECVLLEAELLLFLKRADEAFQRTSESVRVLGDERRLLTVQIRAAALSGHRADAQELQTRLSRLVRED